jgi:hypothetical protein
MIRDGKEILILYLTDWQTRMVHDILKVDNCHTLEIPIAVGNVVRYGIREATDKKLKKMYLTDWQKAEMMDETGSVCNFIELDHIMAKNVRYGMQKK